ncbi:hypothetical protein X798_02708 [Onchocerca flexuosa]|uniref:Uncharacterized protein n=1 Tax=Onchocerca flexuosa TaxID=387005 RepID=A0A238BZN9_9BILA|nr:hypothetical protein X798_02708 [Onchocerca flexuosa]
MTLLLKNKLKLESRKMRREKSANKYKCLEMNWELVVSICQALLVVSMSNQLSFDIYPRLNKGKVDIIAANYKVNGMIKSACWIRINPYNRRAVIEEYGLKQDSQSEFPFSSGSRQF